MSKSVWGILAALALLAPASASANGDYGDAPDGAAARYSNLSTIGAFPSLATSGGPRHRRVGLLELGAEASSEGDSRQVDADTADDGVEPVLKPCSAKSELRTAINATRLPKSMAKRDRTVYVNAWFDWNRDGDWEDDDDRCAPEWAIENFPVSAATLREGALPLSIQFVAGSQVRELWYRVTLTLDEPVAIADGGAPLGGYALGETEDHLLRPGGGDGFDPKCVPNPKVMLHGRVDGVSFDLPTGLDKPTGGLKAAFVGAAAKGTFRRFQMKGGVPVGIRYAEARDGPTRVHGQTVKVRLSAPGKKPKVVACRFTVTHTAPHKHGKKAKKRNAREKRWKHWRKRSWHWRKYRRPRRNPHVVLTKLPSEKSESKQYAATVKYKLQRHKHRKKGKKRYRHKHYKRMLIVFSRYSKLGQRKKKLWAISHSTRKRRKFYKRYLRRCKMRALSAHRRSAGRSVGRGGPAVLDCPIAWRPKQSVFSFNIDLNPEQGAPLVVFLQDAQGNWTQPNGRPVFDPSEPSAPDQNSTSTSDDSSDEGDPPPDEGEPPALASQVNFQFCGSGDPGACVDPNPNPLIRFEVTFEAELAGFAIQLDSSRVILGGNVTAPGNFPCQVVPSATNNVLGCQVPIQPGTTVIGIFQTNAATVLDPCEEIVLIGNPVPGGESPPPLPTQVQGAFACGPP